MNTPSNCLIAASLALTVAATAGAQNRSVLAALQQGVVVRTADGAYDLLYKPLADQQGRPQLFPVTGTQHEGPTYRVQALFDGYAGYGDIELDAISTGNDQMDFVRVDGTDTFQMVPAGQSPGWVTLQMSFRAQDDVLVNGPANTPMQQRIQALGDVIEGADLYTYWNTENALPDDFTDVSDFVAGVEHLGLDPRSRAGFEDDVVGLDTFMAINISTHNSQFGRAWYFSVTPSTAMQLAMEFGNNASLQNRFESGVEASDLTAGTVFKAEWDSGSETWGRIEIHATPRDLGLKITDDIDALGIYAALDDAWVLYSLAGASSPQLQVGMFPSTPQGEGESFDVVNANGEDLVHRVDHGIVPPNDVNAICGIDPEHDYNPWILTPDGWDSLGSGPQFEFSIAVDTTPESSGTVERLGFQVSGIPPIARQERVAIVASSHTAGTLGRYLRLGVFNLNGAEFNGFLPIPPMFSGDYNVRAILLPSPGPNFSFPTMFSRDLKIVF